jgi:sensor histidine kinase regulating citrate/malate metabolism
VTSLKRRTSRTLRSLSIRTKLLLMMLALLLISVSSLFFLHLISEQRLLAQVRDYTDELSTAIDIAQQQPADAADPKATLIALQAYAERLRRLGVKDVALTDAADEIQAATNPALVGKRGAQLCREARPGWIVKGVLGDEPAPTQKLSTLRVPLLVGDRRVGYMLITRSVDDFSDLSRQNLYYRLVVTLAVFGVGMAAALYLSKSFSRPLQDLNQAARSVATGDLAPRCRTRATTRSASWRAPSTRWSRSCARTSSWPSGCTSPSAPLRSGGWPRRWRTRSATR